MFNRYYESELTYLRELGREFAESNPELAGVFAERGGDPDVERLLEGFAFLTARIRERMNDAVPELVESLSQLLLPHYVRTQPACSIVQFSPYPHAIRGRHTVRRGTEVAAKPMHGTACLFQTTTDVDLLPLSIEHAQLDDSSEATPEIRIAFRCQEANRRSVFEGAGIRVFIQGPLAQSSVLHHWFCRSLTAVTYRNQHGQTFELPLASVKPVGLDEDHTMLPWPKRAPRGPRLLQEYFTLPQKLLFLDFLQLDRVPEALLAERFELCFRFQRPPRLQERLDEQAFQLFCTPVVNLFSVGADPFQADVRVQEHLLRPSGMNPRHADIFDITSVVGLRDNRRARRNYTRFFDFAHANLATNDQSYFSVRRTLSPIDSGIDTYLSILTPRESDIEPGQETLSIDLVCTNRFLPGELRLGDICVPTPRSPTVARFTNITGVTSPAIPPLGSELHWRLLSHVALNQNSLADAESLRAMLSLYDLLPEGHPQGRTNRLRIASIREVTARPARHVMHDVPVRGTALNIVIDENNFPSIGDAFLFGCALDSLFGALVPINSFSRLTLTLHPTLAELTWPARNGTQTLL